MSIRTIVTRGYGRFGSIADVVRRGYGWIAPASTSTGEPAEDLSPRRPIFRSRGTAPPIRWKGTA